MAQVMCDTIRLRRPHRPGPSAACQSNIHQHCYKLNCTCPCHDDPGGRDHDL